MAARSHRPRSCSASRSSLPSGAVRVSRRASVSRISASSPATSPLPGSSRCSIRARSAARSTRSRRIRSEPVGAVCPVLKTRCTTSSTASTRCGNSASAGTRYGIRAALIFFLARVMRAAMVGSLTRKARATSAVDSPHSRRRVSATWASRDSAGWQQVKISRSRSSGYTASWSVPACAATATSAGSSSTLSSTSSGSRARKSTSRRITSMARRLATVVSHAPGRSGTPVRAHAVRACANASWTHSSATSRSRVMRAVAASTKPHSARCACATASAIALPAVLTARARGPQLPITRRS